MAMACIYLFNISVISLSSIVYYKEMKKREKNLCIMKDLEGAFI